MPLTATSGQANGGLFFNNSPAASIITLPVETEINIFKQKAIKAPSIAANYLGMYTLMDIDRELQAVYGSFSGPKHNLKKRGKGCHWDPSSCGVKFSLEKIPTCPIEIQQEQCVNILWDTCWEKLLGKGKDIHNMEAIAEGTRLLQILLEQMYVEIGNDYYNLVTFGLHPLIEEANENKWYADCNITEDEWGCFYKQQQACGGLLTQVDHLKEKGIKNFGVEIKETEISADGSEFVGSAIELFQRLKKKQGRHMSTYSKQMGNGNLIIGVTPSIFSRYKEELIQDYKNIPQSLYLLMKGTEMCDTCVDTSADNVLMYDGCWVVCMDEWALLDYYTCTYTHRAILFAPGVFGIAYDVSPAAQDSGMGLEITRWNIDPNKGKTYFSTNFRVGTALIDTDYMVAACRTVIPESKI